MKKCVVTGAAGFTGCGLVEELVKRNWFVYAVVRPQSEHNVRLLEMRNVQLVYADMSEFCQLDATVNDICDVFFHLAWQGGRYDFTAQHKNITDTLGALEAAARLGCRRFVCTGSQAEYGPQKGLITENIYPAPVDAYGAAKLAACILTREKAKLLGIDWLWGRIFSLYGKYEPNSRMLPVLVKSLQSGRDFHMTSDGRQNWDYLYVNDAARALIAMSESAPSEEIYNIAYGCYRTLREYVHDVQLLFSNDMSVYWNEGNKALFSLQVSVEKLKKATGWQPQVDFTEGIKMYEFL